MCLYVKVFMCVRVNICTCQSEKDRESGEMNRGLEKHHILNKPQKFEHRPAHRPANLQCKSANYPCDHPSMQRYPAWTARRVFHGSYVVENNSERKVSQGYCTPRYSFHNREGNNQIQIQVKSMEESSVKETQKNQRKVPPLEESRPGSRCSTEQCHGK